jgi:DDE_Tnp_1-associated
MTRTDARACRPIIPDPSRPHPTAPTDPLELQDAEAPHLLAYQPLSPTRERPVAAAIGWSPSSPWPAAAVLAGARSIAAIAEWAADTPQPVRAALGARRDALDHLAVPAEATIRRTLARLDADALAAVVGAWLADRERVRSGPATTRRRAVAVDGKTLRGARTGAAPSAMACLRNLVIGVLCRAGPVNLAAARRFHGRDPHRPLATLGIGLG